MFKKIAATTVILGLGITALTGCAKLSTEETCQKLSHEYSERNLDEQIDNAVYDRAQGHLTTLREVTKELSGVLKGLAKGTENQELKTALLTVAEESEVYLELSEPQTGIPDYDDTKIDSAAEFIEDTCPDITLLSASWTS